MALLDIKLGKIKQQTEAQEEQLDTLKAGFRSGAKGGSSVPFRMGGSSLYEELKEDTKDKRRKQGRCLW